MKRPVTVVGLLSRAFAAMVVLLLLSGLAGIAASVLQHQSIRRLSEHITPLRLANRELRVVFTDAQVSLRGYLLTGDTVFLSRYADARGNFEPVVRRMRGLADTDTERAAVDEQARHAARWWAHADRQHETAPRSEEAARRAETGRMLADPMLAANTSIDEYLADREAEVRHRSSLLRTDMLISQAVLTGLAMLLAAVTAVRTTNRITRPLHRLVTVLGRLGAGDHTARAAPDLDLAEISAVAGAVNALADEADRVRRRDAVSARLAADGRALGIRIREHLSVGAVLEEGASGLGPLLSADHALVRLAGTDGDETTTASWSRDGDIARLARLSPDWLLAGGSGTYVWNDLDDTGTGTELPAEERAALRAAGAGAVLTVVFCEGGPSGAVTLVRGAGRARWSPEEARAVEFVVADLGRGLLHAALYEREQELVARLRDLDKAKTDFMSTVSHELRTPLTSIAGYLEMLVDGDAGELTETQQRMLTVIDRNTTRLRGLIEDLLVLSRIEAGTLRTSHQEVEYGWLITSAVAAVAPVAAAAGVEIETDVGGPLAGRADPSQIDRVLTNLLSNAVKFTPRGGRVRVHAYRDGTDVVVLVGDTGIGIPESEQGDVFTRFYRASNATDQAVPGTGLGLAIVHTIVTRHDGQVTLRSREGEGTTVTVRLPA